MSQTAHSQHSCLHARPKAINTAAQLQAVCADRTAAQQSTSSHRIPARSSCFGSRPVAPAPSFLPLPPAHHADLFTYYSDTETITEGLTVAFLGHLQTTIGISGVNSSANADLEEVIQEFKSVARDVLSYLRYHNSQALLLLLRQYSQTRAFTMADVDPDVLQQEVQQLLDLRELGNWYARVSRRDTDGYVTRPTIGIQATEASVVTTPYNSLCGPTHVCAVTGAAFQRVEHISCLQGAAQGLSHDRTHSVACVGCICARV